MPTSLPSQPVPVRGLSWPQVVRLLALMARVRWLDMRARALVGRGAGFSDDRLLRLMQKWLACHEAIAALLPHTPEPEHVRQVRTIILVSAQSSPPVDGIDRFR